MHRLRRARTYGVLAVLIGSLVVLGFADNLQARGRGKSGDISDPAVMQALQGKLIDALSRSDKPPPIKAKSDRALRIGNEYEAPPKPKRAAPVPVAPTDPLMAVVLAAMHRAPDLPDLPPLEPDCDPVPLAHALGRAGLPQLAAAMGPSSVTSAQMIAALPIAPSGAAPLVGAAMGGDSAPRLTFNRPSAGNGPSLPAPGAPTAAMAPATAIGPCKRAAQPQIDWSYQGEGAPANWGGLRVDFAACSIGARQSPVPLDGAIPITTRPFDLQYRPSRFEVLDDGRNLVVGMRGASSLRFEGLRLRLDQIRFHRPGEHWIKGVRPDMSAHLIHESPSGITLVVAVPLMRGHDPNPALQQILNAIPLEPGGAGRGTERLDLTPLLPDSHDRYVYQGSLSTPPCTEGVHWMVLQQPVMISDAQYEVFAKLFAPNARPIQALNGRRVKGTM